MLRQIRLAMKTHADDFQNNFHLIMEMDETYVGGKPRKGNNKQSTKSHRGRGTNKIPVIGVLDRINKKAFAKVAMPNKEGKKLTGKQLLDVLKEAVKDDVIVITDEFRGYNILKGTNHIHFQIDHTKEYAHGEIHTNNISAWSIE